MSIETMPDIFALVDAILGRSYEDYNCWDLLRDLYGKGWGIDLDTDPAVAANQVVEIWFQADTRDPLTVVQPWDLLVFRPKGLASSHVGVMCDNRQFVHTRETYGTCRELLVGPKWLPRLLQIARLRRLL
jgi:cell wall-associated NlpC family hydrolase